MKTVAFFALLIAILAGCSSKSSIYNERKLKGLTKGQRVTNNLNRAKTEKSLKRFLAKLIDPQW